MSTKINYAKYQERLMALKEKTEKLLLETDNKDLVVKMSEELTTSDERKELRLAFVGQYSSGKSTIISALTGRKDIKIDANVATDIVSEYHWNNIVLMDTPGILAGKVESHDEATKAALKECDLIFYVITSQLFDDVIFNNFIDLAYNQHFADKIFIVVNKMGMEAGDFEQLSAIYTSSLNKIFSERGYNVNEFPIAFIDAADFIEGEDSKDQEFIKLSNFEHFIDMLNAFVSQKGVIKKQFDTPIRILQSYLKNIIVSSIDKTLSDFYTQFEMKLSFSMKEMKRDVNNLLSAFDSSAMAKVINLSNGIGALEETEWNRQQEELNKNLGQIIENTSIQIDGAINQNYERLLNDINEFGDKDSLVKYYDEIETKINSPQISIEEKKSLEKQRWCLEMLKNGGSQVSKLAPNVNKIFGGVSQASGSTLHELVLNVGHFFGKSFKPWEAVRWASNIAKVAKFGIPVLTAGIDIWMQVREDNKETQRLEQIKNSKEQFVTSYQSEINKIKAQFEQYMGVILDNYTNKRNEVNKSKDELIQMSRKNDQLSNSIRELEGEYVDFIEIIDNEN
jgi:GTPase SAR1 family protein